MLYLCLSYLLVMLLLFGNASSQQKQIEMSLQLGQAYLWDIPTIFKNYQQSTLQSFKNAQLNYTLPIQICQIRGKDQGSLNQRGKSDYSSSLSHYSGNSVIYRLKDLQQSKIVIDSITINQQIIALFPPNQVIIYSLDSQNGAIEQQLDFKIDGALQEQLLQASLIEIYNTALIISRHKIRKLYTNGSWYQLQGYSPQKSTITSLQYLQNKLYLGMGEQGLSIYQVDPTLTTVTLVLKTQFISTQNNQIVSFDVDEFQIYPIQTQLSSTARSIFVLDYFQGLIQITLDNIKPEKTLSAKPRFLASSCRNLILFWNSIYLTCPEIIQISKSNYAVIMMKEINFFSQSVKIEKDRLFLFGNQGFAVYDIFGKSLAQYQLTNQSELSMMAMGYLITFGRQSLVSHSIVPAKQQLYCFTKNPSKVGEYTGIIQTGGICKQYNQYTGSVQILRKTWQIYCLVDYSIRVTVRNSAQINLKVEVILLGVILLMLLFFGLYLGFRHLQAHRHYGRLTEQQFKQLKEAGSQIAGKLQNKKSKEEVVNPG